MTRDSFIFYRSFFESISELPDDVQLTIFKAISEYSLNFNEIELTGIAKTIFILIKPQLDANNKRFINGTKPKKSKAEAKQKQTINKSEANKNVNVNKNVNLNKNNVSKIQEKFYHSLEGFINDFDKKTIREFYDYWSEPNKSNTKIKYQLEKTWDTKRRLKRWTKNNFKQNGETKRKDEGFKKEFFIHRAEG